MLFARPRNPVRYDLCCQTVTVYHKTDSGFTRAVHDNAFFDRKKTQTVDKTGGREANSFLLVIPGSVQSIFPGDKVVEGIGPGDIAQWRDLIAANVPGLVVVEYADCKQWMGETVHTEAGG